MKILMACLGMMLALSPAWSRDLGDIQVPVADRSAEARSGAFAEALDQVLIRLTGDRQVEGRSALASVRRDPSRWVQQFSYDGVDSEAALALSVRFAIPVLIRQLEQAAVPVWTTVRPDTLFWLVVQRGAAGEIMSGASTDPAVQSLILAAQARGLPVALPLMDAEDQGRIRAADIRGHFDNVLQQAAARYAAPFNVAAVLYPGATPQIRWRLMYQGRLEDSGEVTASTEAEVLTALVDEVTARIAPRYTVRPGVPVRYRLKISGVGSLDDWQGVTGHAARLAGVSELSVAGLAGSELLLDLNFTGQADQLRALMSLDPRFLPCAEAQLSLAEPTDVVSLCWQGGKNK
jgi:uncharacterized protein